MKKFSKIIEDLYVKKFSNMRESLIIEDLYVKKFSNMRESFEIPDTEKKYQQRCDVLREECNKYKKHLAVLNGQRYLPMPIEEPNDEEVLSKLEKIALWREIELNLKQKLNSLKSEPASKTEMQK